MNTIKSLIIYPIKSLGGIEVASAEAMIEGFENDRRWMLVDNDGQFQTQREMGILSLFKTSIEDNNIRVAYKDSEILFPMDYENSIVRDVNVFEHNLKAQEVDSDVNKWFSKHLNKEVQLVKMTKISDRVKEFKKPPFRTNVSLADGYPYLILGTQSMDYLNNQLTEKISFDRFRPNVLAVTNEKHVEDEWDKIQIGEATFQIVKPCARCQVTTINQQTSEKGKEPLKTLSTYRKVEHKINFGANMILVQNGKVSVGDTIQFI